MAPVTVTQFECGVLALADFHHAQHLEVALWYTLQYPPAEAFTRMRDGLQRLLARSGRQEAYNEELTVRWMKRIDEFVRAADRTRPFEQLYAALLAVVGSPSCGSVA